MIPCEVVDLKKQYGYKVALDNVSLRLKEAEIFGLIGPKECGKTSIMNAIMGLTLPSSGDVALFQNDAYKMGAAVRIDAGYAPSKPSFYPNLSVYDNLKFVASVKKVPIDRLDYLATELELNLSKRASDLNEEQGAKYSIVLALLSSPKLVVLDEPMVHLQQSAKQALLKILEEEKKRGATILISAAELTDVQRVCDRVAVMSKGKVVAVEQMEQLKLKRLKLVTIETKYSEPMVTLSGVSNLVQEGNLLKFNYNGEIKKLVNYLNTIDIDNIKITDADLEKIFLYFYE